MSGVGRRGGRHLVQGPSGLGGKDDAQSKSRVAQTYSPCVRGCSGRPCWTGGRDSPAACRAAVARESHARWRASLYRHGPDAGAVLTARHGSESGPLPQPGLQTVGNRVSCPLGLGDVLVVFWSGWRAEATSLPAIESLATPGHGWVLPSPSSPHDADPAASATRTDQDGEGAGKADSQTRLSVPGRLERWAIPTLPQGRRDYKVIALGGVSGGGAGRLGICSRPRFHPRFHPPTYKHQELFRPLPCP